jgi:hypothetical protein
VIPDAANYAVTLTSTSNGTINAEPITITATANTKTYDNSTAASATPTVTSGTLYDLGSSTLAETYASADAGVDLTLTPTASIPDSANYAVTLASTSNGTINAEPITTTAEPIIIIADQSGFTDQQPTGAPASGPSYNPSINPQSVGDVACDKGHACGNVPYPTNLNIGPGIRFVPGI